MVAAWLCRIFSPATLFTNNTKIKKQVLDGPNVFGLCLYEKHNNVLALKPGAFYGQMFDLKQVNTTLCAQRIGQASRTNWDPTPACRYLLGFSFGML